MTSGERSPPHSIDAEIAVLCAMMISPDVVPLVFEFVTADAFYREAHRRIFRAITGAWEAGDKIDVITIAERLKKTSELEAAGGIDYLGELVSAIPHSAHAEHHAKIVRENAVLRRLIKASSETIQDAYDVGERTVGDILSAAEARVMAIETGAGTGPLRAREKLWEAFEHIGKLQEQEKDEVPGIASGLYDLDRFTLGLRRGELTVIAARPSMGKSALAMTWLLHATLAESIPSLVFSFEMTSEELLTRAIAVEGQIPLHALLGGRKLTPEEYERMGRASTTLNTAPLFIDDSPDGNLRTIEAKARRLRMSEDVGLVVIDYLQLMDAAGEDRRRELEQITKRLKQLARGLDIPIVLISQLSRGPEQRTNKRPMLSDLRDTGAIEQDADRVIFIFRPEYYQTEAQKQKDAGKFEGLAELIIPKQRNGAVGQVKAYFRKTCTRFESFQPSVW